MVLRPPTVVSASTDGGQADLEPAPPPLLDGPRLGHGPLELGGAEPLLHAGQVAP